MMERGERFNKSGVRLGLPRVTRTRVFAGLACLFGGVIAVNAMLFQSQKHPAPMFRQIARPAPKISVNPPAEATTKVAALPVPPLRPEITPHSPSTKAGAPGHALLPAKPNAAPEASEALLVEIQKELAKRGYYKGEPDGKPGPATTKAIRDFQFEQRVAMDGVASEALLMQVLAQRTTMKDELLDLVKNAGASARAKAPELAKAPEKPATPEKSAQDERTARTIADVQRALTKAGYGPLEADGRMGPATKAALAKFEADRKLPARGEPSGPVLRYLAAASGVRIAH